MNAHLPETLADGRYELRGMLGAGAMATVSVAWDTSLEVERAIKILSPQMAKNEKVRIRFVQEARTMARLKHPNIVTVHDVGLEGEHPFIVMEKLDGGSLADRLEKGGVLPPRLACRVVVQILAGLEVAHQAHVVHRDVKPQNVLISLEGKPKLTDFGIAQVTGTNHALTRTGVIMGTLAFMAPEQRTNARDVDLRADIYSASATLYLLVTGRVPLDLYSTELHEEVFADVMPGLVKVLQRGTRYAVADRYSSAAEMAEALEALIPQLPEDPADTPPLVVPPEPEPPASGSGYSPFSSPVGGDPSMPTYDGFAAGDVGVDVGSYPPTRPLPRGGAPAEPGAFSQETTDGFVIGGGFTLGERSEELSLTEAMPSRVRRSVWAFVALGVAVAGGLVMWPEGAPLPSRGIQSAPTAPEAPVEIAPDAPVELTPQVEPDIVRLPRPTPVTPTPVTPTPVTPTPVVEVGPPPDAAAVSTATLAAMTMPFGKVVVDDRLLGNTGRRYDLAVGIHRVEILTDAGESIVRSIDIQAGEITNLCHDFSGGDFCAR